MVQKVKDGKVSKKPPKKLSEIDDIFNSKPAAAQHAITVKKKGTAPTPLLKESKQKSPSSSVKIVDATNAGKSSAASSNSSSFKKKHTPIDTIDDDGFADSRGKNSKYTDDGMRVYYLDDLRIGEGEGDSELCPFDCDCCF